MTPHPGPPHAREVGAMSPTLLAVFIPGKIVNPQASSRGGTWHKRARLARGIREQTAAHILAARTRTRVPCPAATPKLVVFTAWVWNLYDDDNLRTALKPYRDALKDMRLIDDDRVRCGHQFDYDQFVTRGREFDHEFGVDIVVKLLIPAHGGHKTSATEATTTAKNPLAIPRCVS